jgi:hypothetical protein
MKTHMPTKTTDSWKEQVRDWWYSIQDLLAKKDICLHERKRVEIETIIKDIITTLQKEADERVAEARRKEKIELINKLGYYVQHDTECILSHGEAGRPTKDGSYETRYAGKWFKVGAEPKCDCGLEQALTPDPK